MDEIEKKLFEYLEEEFNEIERLAKEQNTQSK